MEFLSVLTTVITDRKERKRARIATVQNNQNINMTSAPKSGILNEKVSIFIDNHLQPKYGKVIVPMADNSERYFMDLFDFFFHYRIEIRRNSCHSMHSAVA